jgi:hypothetical protein
LQPRPVSYAACAFTLTPPQPLLTPVPLLVLRTQLLPWTVWIACMPLPPLSSWIFSLRHPAGCLSTPVPDADPVRSVWSVVTRSPFLVCMSCPHSDLLLPLQLPHLQTVLVKFPFRGFHSVLFWFRVVLMTRFYPAPKTYLSFLFHFPSHCSPSTCLAGWWPWVMPSRVWLRSICFFFFFSYSQLVSTPATLMIA